MTLKTKYAVARGSSVALRMIGLLMLLCAFRHEAKADPVTAIASGIGGIGSLISGLLGSKASTKAADVQSNNADQVAALIQQYLSQGQGGVKAGTEAGNSLIAGGSAGAQQALGGGLAGSTATLADIFKQEAQNLDPYMTAGQQGVDMLTKAVGEGGSLSNQFSAPTAEEAAKTPGYQFVLDQGTKAITNNAAARGLTGGTLKDITQFGQGAASQYYQQAYNNALSTFGTNRTATMQNLQALLGVGEFGTNSFNSAAQNAGNQISNNQMTTSQQQASLINGSAQQQANNIIGGEQFNANLGMQGAGQIGNAFTGGANAQAAGIVGSANGWQQAIAGLTNAAQGGVRSFNPRTTSLGTVGGY